jgi:hypothetical protein
MIVILQRLINIYFLSCLILSCPLYAQLNQVDCNNETFLSADQKKIPIGVCIPKGYVIRYIYSKYNSIDFNRDGLIDFAFSVTKRTNTIGDSSFLVFYKMNIDSSFTFSKLFKNTYPIYFNPSDENPKIKDTELKKLFDCYPIPDPLDHLDIKNDTIEIDVTIEGHGYQAKVYQYKYDLKRNDWKLINNTLHTTRYGDDGEEIHESESLPISKDLWLSNFSYCEDEE